MVFSNIICLFYQLLVLCVLTVGADMYNGILVHFGRNFSPGKIDDGGRVEITLPSSRLRCFATCARDPNCSKCVRYDNDGTVEAAFKKVLRSSHPHADEYVLKCGYTDKSAPPTQDTGKSASPTQDINKSPPPTQDTDKSASPTQGINKSPPPIQDTDKSVPPTQDINKSPSPTQDTNKSPPPTQDTNKSQLPTQDINKSPPPTQDIHKSPPPTQDINESPPPTQDTDKSPQPTQDINKSPPPTQDINKSTPPTQDIDESTPPTHNVHKSPELQDKDSSTLQNEKPAGNVLETGPSSEGLRKEGSVSQQAEPGTEALENRMTTISTETTITEATEVFIRGTYEIVTETGKSSGSSTDCFVHLKLYGDKDKTEMMQLQKGYFNMDEGQVDTFQFNSYKDIGNITKMEFMIEQFGISPNWFCVRMELERRRQYTRHTQVEVYHSSLNKWYMQGLGFLFESRTLTYNIPYTLKTSHVT